MSHFQPICHHRSHLMPSDPRNLCDDAALNARSNVAQAKGLACGWRLCVSQREERSKNS